MREVVVAGAVRTPIGRYGGGLVKLGAVDLGVHAATEAMKRAGVEPSAVDFTYFGHGRQGGNGTNTARQVSFRSGIPAESPAMTVNMACASSMKSITLGMQDILMDEADVVLAGGMESMSNTPYLLPNVRWGLRLGHSEVLDGQYQDGFKCPLTKDMMGRTAETLAEQFDITRLEQDEYAVRTQHRCQKAREEGRFDAEKAPIEVPGRKGPTRVEKDEHARDNAKVESMAKLPAVFKKDGTVHAGNSSGITDGAAAMVVMAKDKADELGVTPMARLTAWSVAGVDPAVMGIGPVPAIRSLFKRKGWTWDDFDLIELNEAFAAQVIACDRELHMPWERTNVNGGSIALGHPIGCTGSRICVTLLHEMEKRDAKRGMATLCVSGGMGMALVFERD